jgi:peptidyl-prolyl cis-trans isomerase D
MIQNLRYYSDNWFFKGLLGLIVCAFVFFGVGDLIKSLVYDRPIAVVGSDSISMEELDFSVKNDLEKIKMSVKKNITLADLNASAFVQRSLDNLISKHLLKQEQENLKIVASDDIVRQNIHTLTPFLKDGKFNIEQFRAVLQNNRLSEQKLVTEIRSQIINQQYFSSFLDAAALPSYYKKILLDSITKRIAFSTLYIDFNAVSLDEKISDQDIESYYSTNTEGYKKPETRDVDVLVLDIDKLSKKINVDENDLKKTYEDRKDIYASPEKRTFKKYAFENEKDAQSFLKDIESKILPDASLKKIKYVKIEEIKDKTRIDLEGDEADTVFSLEKGVASTEIEKDEKFYVYIVDQINKQQIKPFDQVRKEIEKDIRIERFSEEYKNLKNKIEDDLASGITLKEIASSLKLNIITMNKITNNMTNIVDINNDLKGFEKDLLEQSFNLTEGNASNVIDISFDKSFIIYINKITPESIPELSQIKDLVRKDLEKEKKREKAHALAQKISVSAKKSSDLEKEAIAHKYVFKPQIVYSRFSIQEEKELIDNSSISVLDRAFSMPFNRATFGEIKNGFLVVMPLMEASDKAIKSDTVESLSKRIDNISNEAVMGLLINRLKSKYSVNIKSKNLEYFLKLITRVD